MKESTTKIRNAHLPETCAAQVQAFLETSARYLGLTRGSGRMVADSQCLPEVPVPLACSCQHAGSQLAESRL
jgi:hypothetical protein